MAKGKRNAYEIFVNDSFNQMRRNGQNPNRGALFGQLSGAWQNLSEDEKQLYKDRAKYGDNHSDRPPPQPPRPQFHHQSTQPKPPQPTAQQQAFREDDSNDGAEYGSHRMPMPGTQHSQPSTSNRYAYNGQSHVKTNISPIKAGASAYAGLDSKPAIKEERGIKRKLEVAVGSEQQGDQGQQQHQHQEQNEQHEPPRKKGYAVPNWRNIKNSAQPEADRYFDYSLVKLRNTCESIVASKIHQLMTFPLYTFSCNVLCKYKDVNDKNKYIPLEIGIYAYTIKDGQLGKPFHAIINSGPPPRNYWNDTHDHMTSTHKIKVTQTGEYPPEARTDYQKIYKQMCKYTRGGERTILVADKYDLEQVRSCIEWLYDKSFDEEVHLFQPSSWSILPLVDFVAAAYNHIYCHMLKYPLPKFTLHYFLQVRLETSIWDYEVQFMCDYHKHDDHQTKWCARNCAIRSMKAIELTLDEMYEHYKRYIEIREGKAQQQDQQQQRQGAATQATTEPKRQPAQQMQQPLHMPEEKEPPPIIEEVARLEEMRKRAIEEAIARAPPAPYHQFYYEIPRSPPTSEPLAIQPSCPEECPSEDRPTEEQRNKLDPRLNRNEPELPGGNE